jgi:LacI family transcriptional regulator
VATIRDVAEAAQVSRATAARALNRYGYVSEATARKIFEAAERLGYQTNLVAQALRSGHLPVIGFVPGDIQNPFFARIARDVESELREHGYNMVIASTNDSVDQEKQLVGTLRSLSVTGFIMAPASSDQADHIAALVEERVPLVLVDRALEAVEADSVIVDNLAGARSAIDYLIGRGHRRIGVITDESGIFTSRQRVDGYRAALEAHGIAPDESLISVSRSTTSAATEAALRLLRRPERPTALFTVDSVLTQGALLAIRSMGLAIPGEVSVVGFDDFDLATFVDPQITVVAQPVSQIGTLSGRLLMSRLSGYDGEPRRISLETKLVERGSVVTLRNR